MIKKTLYTTTGEKIYIYDNVFSSYRIEQFQYFMEYSNYKTGTSSVLTQQKFPDNFLSCILSQEDLKRFSFLEMEETKQILLEHNLKYPDRYWFLMSTHMSQYQFHVDGRNIGDKTLLYYGNGKWDKNWGGETLFCNNKGEIEIAVEFKPNRIVLFDNHIEHKPAPLSLLSYPYRFIFVAQFSNYK